LESAGALLLAAGLEDNDTITKINLGGNYIGPAAVRKLEECMSPMYRPCDEELGLSTWDTRSHITPFLLNRKARLAPPRPKSASAVMSRAPPKKRDTTINVNSRKSVVITKSNFIRPSTARKPRINIKELFSISTPKPRNENNSATLPAIQKSLKAIDDLLARGKHNKVAPRDVIRQLKDNWVHDTYTAHSNGKRSGGVRTTDENQRDSKINSLFQVKE
jgi:hypothetical protein